jgi:dephospho-CoA kinase
MKLVVTVGMPGSGKDEIVSVAKDLGFHVIKMGDLVRAETQRRRLPLNDQNIGRIANEEREKHGHSIWAKRVIPLVTETKTLIDGCRGDDELSLFRHNFGDLVLIGVHSSPDTRYERLLKRGRGDDAMSHEAFYERDRRELKFGIGNALALADHMLVNEGTVQELRHSAEEVLRTVLE